MTTLWNEELYLKLKHTPTFVLFAKNPPKSITEDEYNALMGECMTESGDKYPENWDTMGVLSKWGWSNKRKNTFSKLFNDETNVRVIWKTDFEDRFKEWIATQGDNPGLGPSGKVDWYSQKRKEFEELYKKEEKEE